MDENWALVSGDITEVRSIGSETTVVLYVEGAKDYDGFPNLFANSMGELITVDLPDGAESPRIGSRVEWCLCAVDRGKSKLRPLSEN